MLRVDDPLHVGRFAARLGGGAGDQAVQQLHRRLWCMRHLVFELVGGETVEAHQLGLVGTQPRKLSNEVAHVVWSGRVAPLFARGHHARTQVTVGQLRQNRLLRRIAERQHVRPGMSARLCSFDRRPDPRVVQPVELCRLVDDDGTTRGRRQQFLLERGLQPGDLLVQRPQRRLVGRRQGRPSLDELLVGLIEQETGFRLQVLRVGAVMHRLQPRE